MKLKYFTFGRLKVKPLIDQILDKKAFTLVELMIVVAIVGILATVSVSSFNYYKERARDVITMYDLDQYKKVLITYHAEYDTYIGDVGESIGNDGGPSDFSVPDYSPTTNIRITVTSASPNPYIVEATHTLSSHIYTYNFKTGDQTRN